MNVAVMIEVDGSPLRLNLKAMRWVQSLYEYDRFALTVTDPDLAPSRNDKVTDLAQTLSSHLGKNLVVHFDSRQGQLQNHLEALITSVRGRYLRRGSEVVLLGAGAAHILDQVVHTRLFLDKTWEEIVREVIGPATSRTATTTVDLGSWAGVKVPFCCQYQETDFAFLRRLCAGYGWILCAAGNDLMVVSHERFSGFPGYATTTTLIPGANCLLLEAGVQTVPSAYETGTYQYYGERGLQAGNYGDESTKIWASQSRGTGRGHVADGISAGATLYTLPGSSHDSGIHWGQRESDARSARWTARAAGEAASFGGETWAPELRLGRKVQIEPEEDLAVDWVASEKILVTEVEHYLEAGDYSNRFAGCAVESPRLLNPAAFPNRERLVTFPAAVTKSDDPSRVGRINVKPLALNPRWMPETIPVRLAARSAGADHGELLQPEIGDEVILAFQPDAFEEPIVTGVLYNGSHKTLPDKLPSHANLQQAQIDTNDLKWHLTRGGNAVIFDDTSGSERILVVTKTGSLELSEVSSGPHMLLTVRDGQDPKCTFTFDKQGQVTLKSKNVLFDIEETVEIKCGKDFILDAQGKIDLKAGMDYRLEATGKSEQKSGTDTKIEAGTKAQVKSGTDTEIKAGMHTKIEAGMNASLKGGMQLKLEGGMQSELKGGAMVTIQGGIVKIN